MGGRAGYEEEAQDSRSSAAAPLPPLLCRRASAAAPLPPRLCRRASAAAPLPPRLCVGAAEEPKRLPFESWAAGTLAPKRGFRSGQAPKRAFFSGPRRRKGLRWGRGGLWPRHGDGVAISRLFIGPGRASRAGCASGAHVMKSRGQACCVQLCRATGHSYNYYLLFSFLSLFSVLLQIFQPFSSYVLKRSFFFKKSLFLLCRWQRRRGGK